MRTWSLLLLASSSLLGQEPSPSSANARVEGRIIDTEGRPLAQAEVFVASRTLGFGETKWTAADGTFSVVAPVGTGYTIQSQKTGYLRGAAGLDGATGRTLPPQFTLRPGETLQVGITLVEQAVVTGRITTIEGDAANNVAVQLREVRYDLGVRETDSRGSTTTDDRGVYRIANLPPGRYLLAAGVFGVQAFGATAMPRLDPIDGSIITFYPGVSAEAKAVPIEVASGRETKIDLALQRGSHYTWRGTLTDASGTPLAGYGVSVWRTRVRENRTQVLTTGPEGQLVIPNLEPGDYQLRLGTPERKIPFSIGSNDVNGGILRPPASIILRGSIESDEGELKLQFMAEEYGVAATESTLTDGRYLFAALAPLGAHPSEWRAGKIRGDRSFELTELIAGEHQFVLAGMPEGSYVKSVIQGDRDVTHQAIQVPGEPLRVVLSAGGAEVKGTVGRSGEDVVLWPQQEDRGNALHGIRMAVSNQAGAFSFKGVPPGAYRIASFHRPTPGVLWNFAFLNQFADEAAPLIVSESAAVPAEPPLIPAERFNEAFTRLQ